MIKLNFLCAFVCQIEMEKERERERVCSGFEREEMREVIQYTNYFLTD